MNSFIKVKRRRRCLEVGAEIADDIRFEEVFFEGLAFAETGVCPALPAWVLIVFDEIFPKTKEVIIRLGGWLFVGFLSSASWAML